MLALLGAGLGGVGCSSRPPAPALPCAGHPCTLTVQNNSGTDVTIRYVDSTGRGEVLGLVPPAEVKRFQLRWIRSAGVRLYAETRGQGTFQSDVALEPVVATEVRFPDGFILAPDLVLFPRKP
jgi:hypothetical protein